MADKNKSITDALVRGILLGGSVGVIAGLVLAMDLSRALFLGMLCGVLGAVTSYSRARKK